MKRAVLALVLVAAACNPQPGNGAGGGTPTPSAAPTRAGAPPLKIVSRGSKAHPLVFYRYKGDRIVSKMVVRDRAEGTTAQGAGDGTFYDVTVTFYDPHGKTLAASAPRAVGEEATQTLTLYDGVVAKTSSGVTLHCRTLVFDRKNGMLHGEGGVRLDDGNGIWTTGNRFDSDIDLQKLSLR